MKKYLFISIFSLLFVVAANKAYSQSDTWLQKADFLGGVRQFATGFSIGTKGYIGTGAAAGDSATQDFWEYDPALDSWTQKADFGGGQRAYFTTFGIGAKGYAGTGALYDALGNTIAEYSDFWEYDPALDKWTQIADYGGSPIEHALGFA